MGEIWDINDKAIVVVPSMEGAYDAAVMAMPYILRQRWLRCTMTLAAIKKIVQGGV